jgi:oxygen-independent coproporphyrinogen-3 oxidase
LSSLRSGKSISPQGGGGFGIYVHWPFCAAKCPYCDFNSHVRAQIDEAAWVSGIARELEYVANLEGSTRPRVDTIFFGGGTPSLMRGTSVGAVLGKIADLWPVASDVEITLESNPASADAERFRDYRAAGVNRLSLGVQALNDADLRFLGRLHNVAEAKAALAMATNTFDRVSLDLIYARPQQTPRQWREELAEGLAFGTEHLSLYQLTIEPATPFATQARQGALHIPDDDSAASLYEVTQELTEAAGRPAYEISNHAAPSAECRHNLLYWRYGDYAGIGPGAHGRLQLSGKRIATSTERLPERWRQSVDTQGHGFIEHIEIADADAAREHLLMNLRLAEGLDLAAYERRWGVSPDPARIAELEGAGLLQQADGMLKATSQGRLVLNSLIAALALPRLPKVSYDRRGLSRRGTSCQRACSSPGFSAPLPCSSGHLWHTPCCRWGRQASANYRASRWRSAP